jgi:tetratricopeptide (TPR) repeat protein
MFKTFLIFVAFLMTTAVIVGQSQVPTTAEEHFESGLRLLKQKQFTQALEAFRMSERLDPKQPATHGNIGSIMIVLKRPADAVNAYQKAIELTPSDASFRTAICRAWAQAKNYESAILACQDGVQLDPDSANAQSALIDVMRLAKRPAKDIRRTIDLALGRLRDAEAILEQAASFYLFEGNLSYSAELYERLTRINPGAAIHYARLADVYLRLDRELEAVTAARKALELDPANPFAQYFMGKLFFELGQNEEASDAFAKVINNDQDFPGAQYYFALSESRRGRHEAALNALNEAAAREPDNFEYQRELGALLNDMARYEDAVAPMRKAVALKPKDLESLAGLGLAQFESARFQDAIAVLQEADRLYPGNEVVNMFLRVARARQQVIPSLDSKVAFAKENPDHLKVRLDLIQLLAYSRRIDEAEQYIQEVWKIAPKEVNAYIAIAVGYSTAGKPDKALDAYRRALAVKEDPAIYLGFAVIYARRGQAEQASLSYAKVLELKPDAPGIMKLFADHLRDNGKRREALDMYKRSLAIQPLNGPALLNAGVLSAKLGDLPSAQRYLADLRNVDPVLARQFERCLRLRIWG